MSTAMGSRVQTERAATLSERLGAPELRELVVRFVRRRVPEPEVDDLVQTVLVDALASKSPPEDDEALRKWLVGISRHKVADFHRRGTRAKHVELSEQLAGEGAPQSAHEWADWAEKQTAGDPDAQRTLDWMARESVGEKLAHIAEQEALPATQVRQRVSRMRRFMKQRWAAELAAVAAIVLLALIAWRLLREPAPVANPEQDVVPVPDTIPDDVAPPIKRARQLRAEAEAACDAQQWRGCLDKLDEARGLDPAGDLEEDATKLRTRAQDALQPPPKQTVEPPAPSPSESVPTRIGPAPDSVPPSTPLAPLKDPGPPTKKRSGEKPPPSTSDGFSIPDKKDSSFPSSGK